MPPAVSSAALDRFIVALAAGASIAEACRAGGVGRRTVYDYRQKDEEFALRWADALEEGTEVLEDVAFKRAVDGSDALLMHLLKARRPEVYRDRVSIEQTNQWSAPSVAERRALQAAAQQDPDLFAKAARALAEAMREDEAV